MVTTSKKHRKFERETEEIDFAGEQIEETENLVLVGERRFTKRRG